MGLNNKSDNTYLRDISSGIAGERVFYKESDGDKTYQAGNVDFQTGTEWNKVKEPKSFDIYNTSETESLTIEFNDDSILMTVDPKQAIGSISISPYIEKVNIIGGTATFRLLLRR